MTINGIATQIINIGWYNNSLRRVTLRDVMDYLGHGQNPISPLDFHIFWESLSGTEKFRLVDLVRESHVKSV